MAKNHGTVNGEIRKVAAKAIASGAWSLEAGTKHDKLRHIPTGRTVVFSFSSSCHRAAKNFQRDMRHVESGLPGWGQSKVITEHVCIKRSR